METKPLIILIEDDLMIREGLREFLEFEGYGVLVAENGKLGLDLIHQEKSASLILLDLQMPVMTGEQVLEVLEKENSSKPWKTPVVVLTARFEGIVHSGIAGLIRKPIDLDLLLDKIKEVISK